MRPPFSVVRVNRHPLPKKSLVSRRDVRSNQLVNCSLIVVLSIKIIMKNLAPNNMTFQSENSWMVQCLSLAMIGMLTYMQIAPIVYGVS